jgi:hypothetical protein
MSKGPWYDFAVLEASKINPKTGKKAEWKVKINAEGEFSCNCPSWIFCKQKPKTCKHCRRASEQWVSEGCPPVQGVPIKKTSVPVVSPLLGDAQRMFDMMCAAANQHPKVKLRNVADQIGTDAVQVMVETLASRLAVFNPAAIAPVAAAEEVIGVRRITFDD